MKALHVLAGFLIAITIVANCVALAILPATRQRLMAFSFGCAVLATILLFASGGAP